MEYEAEMVNLVTFSRNAFQQKIAITALDVQYTMYVKPMDPVQNTSLCTEFLCGSGQCRIGVHAEFCLT